MKAGRGPAFQRVPDVRRILVLLASIIVLLLAGCGKKKISKADIRAITGEIVAAAQKISGHKSEVTIRPELQPSKSGTPGKLAADNVYVSLSDASQAGAIAQELDEIARRHKLSVRESTSDGVVRFDYSSDSIRTHTIHVITPLTAGSHFAAKPGRRDARLAIIIDDLGYDRAAADSLLALGFPLTVSVLPHLPLSTEVAEEAYRRGDQVMLHLPMQSESDTAKTEEVELRVGMNEQQVDSALAGMLETVPHAVGVNNHQGSRATADPALMAALMPELRRRGLFFVDSRTLASTVAYDTAERLGVRAASRKVFLDDSANREAIFGQLELAARDADRDGFAIAIGHPRPDTIDALAEDVPRLEARGIRLVFVSDVVK
ncbi:MAG: divergent polysaccharide deacetylase family protein [Candidatus Acidiferrales bacterium]